MTKTKYRMSSRALEDLEQIWVYTLNKWSKEQADKYYSLIIEEIAYVAGNFDLARKVDHIRVGYRASKIKSHIIFCKRGRDKIVEIVRILHQQMDLRNKLR